VLVEGFRKLRPDLVAFQEAVVGDGYDQVIDILGSGYHLAHQTEREADRGGDIEDGQGISIASRWPVGKVWEPDLNVRPRTEDFACGTLNAEVLAPESIGPLMFVIPPSQLAADLRARASRRPAADHLVRFDYLIFQREVGVGKCEAICRHVLFHTLWAVHVLYTSWGKLGA